MAHSSFMLRNPPSGPSTEDCLLNGPEFDCSDPSDVDRLQFVEGFPNFATIKRLSLRRRPRAAVGNAEKPQSGIPPSRGHPAESLAPSGSDATRRLSVSSAARGRPPLPPPHGASSENKPSRNEGQTASQGTTESKPQPAARSRQSPQMENAAVEKHLNQEVPSQPPQPYPRRRLASFGGVSSPGSLSPFTGLGAYNQNNNGNKPPGTGSETNLSLSLASRGSTGCLRLSPQSSGRTTPVAGLGPLHLQHVRDQMVVALQRLKELEEQVKLIPVLQVKISVLQEEKRQLASQIKNQSEEEGPNEAVWKRACSSKGSNVEGTTEEDDADLREFKQLTEEMQVWERAVKGGTMWPRHEKAVKSVVVGPDKDLPEPYKENKYSCTDQVQTRSVATEVSEVNLGICADQEAELEVQQLVNEALKEKICQLEAELKESALQTELTRLKLELHAAGVRNRVDKSCSAMPSTTSTGTEARPRTATQGVGHHAELRDACTGEATEMRTVGVSCEPEVKNAGTGSDVAMNHWEVRERVETRDKAVGIQVYTSTRGVGTEVTVRDTGSNTMETKSQKGKTNVRSVACGDCSVDVIVCEAKEVVSQGVTTEPIKGVDLGVMASPQTASQRTNTVSSSVSRFTNTNQAFSANSSTNTLLSTQDKHTNTTNTLTRTVSVGNRAEDIRSTIETRTIGVGTASLGERFPNQSQETAMKVTRDTGVGVTNIHENFLVGLKTRNMASGPTHLPDPVKTKSIGVGDGRIRESSSASSPQNSQSTAQLQWDQELNQYIEKMQWLLSEHGDLLAGDPRDQDGTTKTTSSRVQAVAQEATETHQFCSQQEAVRDVQAPSEVPLDSSVGDGSDPELCQQGGAEPDVKRMIKMLEEQTSWARQERSNDAAAAKHPSVTRRQNGEQSCSSNRKSLKFLKVTTGLDPASSYEHDEVEARGNESSRKSSQAGRKAKDGSNKGSKGSTKLFGKRCKLSEKMFFACQALKMHLSDDTALSSRELQDCRHTLQQEWFSVSSHKGAAPDAVHDYLSTFRAISPSVLRHIVNMADDNGNTALHYSVSHSNFGVVKKLLDAEVCEVDRQNAAGYTPVMLAALAAVENPENMNVVEQLLSRGDVNAKASQVRAGQTALMLAVSHGRMDMVRALLAQGAEVNAQDDEGSTALMCASEHGHADMVKLLLAQAPCDATLTDSEDSTALSIALEAGHHDIAVLLYAHANFSRGQPAGAVAQRHCGRRNLFE